jgi:hypothetical protein
MSRRVLTAACSVLTGVLMASAVHAAPSVKPLLRLPPGHGVLLDRTGHVTNLNLGGVTLPAVADARATRPVLDMTRGVQLTATQGRNWDASGNLFPGSTALSPAYLSGTNTYNGASFALSDTISFTASHTTLGLGALSADQPSDFSRNLAMRLGNDVRNAGTTTANLNWNFAEWGGVALTASRTTGNAAMLGVIPSSLGTGAAESASLGISARVGFGEGWVTTVAYSEGVTQLDLSRNLKLSNDPLRSQAYGIGFAKQGVFGDDALGIAVSRPLQVFSGAAALDVNQALAQTMAHESDVALGYVTTFLDGSLALQANAAYQVNAAGTKGQNAATGVVRARLNF